MAAAVDIRVTQGAVLVPYVFPAGQVRTTQAAAVTAFGGKPQLRITQAAVIVLWTGRRENRKLRAWGFSLDGHDFYVLRLGETMTLVHDLTTGQWSRWATQDINVLRTHLGLNWLGMAKTTLDQGYAWNIVGGDDSTGHLWLLDPTVAVDDDVSGDDLPFDRQIIGALPARLRDTGQCGGVYLIGNLGSPALTGDQVTLETSDDSGVNWLSHGAITVTSGDVTQELSWIGLGVMTAPGRLFRITDTGALARVSSLDMR